MGIEVQLEQNEKRSSQAYRAIESRSNVSRSGRQTGLLPLVFSSISFLDRRKGKMEAEKR